MSSAFQSFRHCGGRGRRKLQFQFAAVNQHVFTFTLLDSSLICIFLRRVAERQISNCRYILITFCAHSRCSVFGEAHSSRRECSKRDGNGRVRGSAHTHDIANEARLMEIECAHFFAPFVRRPLTNRGFINYSRRSEPQTMNSLDDWKNCSDLLIGSARRLSPARRPADT